jgi:hypothetical protein
MLLKTLCLFIEFNLNPEFVVFFEVQAAAATIQVLMTSFRLDPQQMVRLSFLGLIILSFSIISKVTGCFCL